MDSTDDTKSIDDFLKIDAVWSEAEKNLPIKEEVISDADTDTCFPKTSNDVDHCFKPLVGEVDEDNPNGKFSAELLSFWETLKRKKKNKNQDTLTEGQTSIEPCMHRVKNFKITKKFLCCGECNCLVCPECSKIVASSMQDHFLGFDLKDSCTYTCKLCRIPFNSLCALQAHIRIHSMDKPYVCPDCGLIYNNLEFLILHLINNCYHIYKIVRYKCKNCPGVYFSFETFVKHIQQLHVENMFRCLNCSVWFSNSDELHVHLETVHLKQKVQYLIYFKCSLCSNIVIPRFMYNKHITQHHESIDSYEIGYQCLCDEIFSLADTFRCHIQHCKEKGSLPPHWSFLEKNLKSQKLQHIENLQTKEALPQSETKQWSSNAASQCKKLSLLKPFEGNIGVNNSEESKNCESLKSNCIEKSNEKALVNQETEISGISEITSSTKNKESDKEVVGLQTSTSQPTVKEFSQMNKTFSQDSLNKTDCQTEVVKLNFKGPLNINLEEEGDGSLTQENLARLVLEAKTNNENIEEIPISKNDREIDQTDPDLPKVFYDHIPCDHLGYVVKTQSPDSIRKDSPAGEPLRLEKRISLQNYNIVTELNEKTGLIITKKVPLEYVAEEMEVKEGFLEEDGENQEVLEMEQVKEGGQEVVENSNSFNMPPKFHGFDKNKLKMACSLFTCPFCVVLFPKHSASFQQFKLHLESYHPDAALNITLNPDVDDKDLSMEVPSVNNATVSIIAENVETGRKNECGVSSKNISKNSPQKPVTRSGQSSFMKSAGVKKKTGKCHLSLESCDKESCLRENQGGMRRGKESPNKTKIISQPGVNTTSTITDLDKAEKENWSSEKNKNILEFKERGEKAVCENLKPCPDEKNSVDKTVQFLMKERLSLEASEQEDDGMDRKGEKRGGIFGTSKSQSSVKKCTTADLTDVDGDGDEVEKIPQVGTGTDVISKKKKNEETAEEYVEDKEQNENGGEKGIQAQGTKCEERNLGSGRKILKAPSDFEDECDTSNHSNWSVGSLEYLLRDSKDSSGEIKFEEKENSRRESEVWSELYESLMLAEKMKKRKPHTRSDSKKKSVVSDYSAKRVVKKPKRYRESSESGDSAGENENSDSDEEFLLSNCFLDNIYWDEKDDPERSATDDQGLKKQKLLRKLEHADGSFLDYLYDLVYKKEKYAEFHKHGSLGGNRYGQDLRNYRKKVLNGIKHRGRSHKVVKCEEVVKSKDPSLSPGDKSGKEVMVQRIKREAVVESKRGEKKRGRPRKIAESVKLKERRRSDKEVDFIEKNFEKSDSELSLSKRKRKLSSKLQYYKKISLSEEADDFSSGQVISNKSVDSSRKLSCAVCKETFPDLEEFREHILVHRTEENMYQCMECGECFVVRPSLEKHLHAFHKIKNTERYIKENQCCDSKREATEVESEPLKENQCKVCKDQFDRAIDLTKHFRIHGMAFLKEFKKEGKAK